MEKKRILIIEDDMDLVEAMRITLEAKGYEVEASYDPEDGLVKARNIKPDLIILDVMFGRKGSAGFTYAIKFKQDRLLAPIPILMSTAVNLQYPNFRFSQNTDGEYLPVDDFIDKPAQPEDLIKRAEALIRKKVSKWANWQEEKIIALKI